MVLGLLSVDGVYLALKLYSLQRKRMVGSLGYEDVSRIIWIEKWE
jgi:hypothetical protein